MKISTCRSVKHRTHMNLNSCNISQHHRYCNGYMPKSILNIPFHILKKKMNKNERIKNKFILKCLIWLVQPAGIGRSYYCLLITMCFTWDIHMNYDVMIVQQWCVGVLMVIISSFIYEHFKNKSKMKQYTITLLKYIVYWWWNHK